MLRCEAVYYELIGKEGSLGTTFDGSAAFSEEWRLLPSIEEKPLDELFSPAIAQGV